MKVLIDGGRSSVDWRRPVTQYETPDIWGRRALALVVVVWTSGVFLGFETALMVLTLCGFAATVWGIRRPYLGVLGASLLCTLDAVTRPLIMTGGLLRWNTLNYWFLGVSLLYFGFIWRSRGAQPALSKILMVWLALQLAQSPDTNLGVQHMLGLVSYFGLLVYFVRALDDDRIWFWIGLVNGTGGALGGMLFTLQHDQLPTLNYNVWAFFPVTAMFAICLAYPFVVSSVRWSLTFGVLAAVNLCWVFLSSSRGDLLIGLIALLFLVAVTRGAAARLSYLGIVALLGTIVVAGFPDMRERAVFRITKLMDSDESVESRTSGRSDLVRGGLHIFGQHPFGVGTGGFARTWAGLGYVEGISGFKYGQEMAAHAGWIKVLVENGVVGFALLAMFVLSFAVVGWHANGGAMRLLGILVTAVLAQALTSTEFQPKGLWFLAAGATTLLNAPSLRAARDQSTTAPALTRAGDTAAEAAA
jgi:hypothetical protein